MKKSLAPVMVTFVLTVLLSLFSAGCVSHSGTGSPENDSHALSLAYFEEITNVPRPSGDLGAIQDYLTAFAEKNHLVCEKDRAGNIRILHPGSSANQPHIILQAHQDMVPAVRNGSSFVFGTDGIKTIIKDGWITAKETSLGADDGAGVAVALAALVSPELKDYSFDAVFTVEEETNMEGAEQLSPEWLDAEYLLNLDTGPLDEICISSAGGADLNAAFTPEREPAAGRPAYRLEVSGLLSGHSGLMIDAGRLNAILIAAEFLSTLEDVQIVSAVGGSAKNSIPGTAEFVFTTTASDIADRAAAFAKSHAVETDPDLRMDVVQVQTPETVWTNASTRTFLDMLGSLPNGCFEKDDLGPRASSNLGLLREDENGTVLLVSFVRANDPSKLDYYMDLVADAYAAATGNQPVVSGRYSSWTESCDSPLVLAAESIYEELFGSRPSLTSIHAGLECGYLKEKNPDLLIVSIGPLIENEHSVEERMNLESFDNFTAYVFALITQLGTAS